MDPRVMPTGTFRCRVSLDQASVQLTRHVRREGKRDLCSPVPRCENTACSREGKPMSLIQVQT